jgi:hypothetical protein
MRLGRLGCGSEGMSEKEGPKSNPYRGFGLLGHGPLDKISRN